MSCQRLRRCLKVVCVPALLVLMLLGGTGCDLAGPTKGPEYQKGFTFGSDRAKYAGQRDRRIFSSHAPVPPRGHSEEWVRGYRDGWKSGVQEAAKAEAAAKKQ
jgi:hypothetical protein